MNNLDDNISINALLNKNIVENLFGESLCI